MDKVKKTLKKTAISGLKWSSASQVGIQGLQLITTIVLARLLSPADYGLMGMAMVWIGFVNIFKDLGTSAAIIQRKDLTMATLSSIFWINLAFGFSAMSILFISSSLISTFYHEPRVINMLRVLSCTFLIASVSIMQQAILQRDMAFDKIAKIEITSVSVSSFIGVILAFMGAGVWSLVYKTVAEIALSTLLLWIFVSWKPKMIFVWREVKSVSKFSLNLTGFNIFNYFSRNTDYLLIGIFLGAQELGYYTMVYRIMLFPLQNISSVICRVFFPIFSKIQDDNIRFKRVYLNVVGTIALVTFPMMIGLFAVSKPFVLTILGQQWKPIILLLMILSPVGMLQSVSTTVGIIYQAKGKTDWMFRWGIFSGILVISAFIVGLKWGVLGVAIAYAMATLILIYPSFWIPFRLIELSVRKFSETILMPLLSSLLMLAAIIILKSVLPLGMSDNLILSILVFMGVVIYILISILINKAQIMQTRDVILS